MALSSSSQPLPLTLPSISSSKSHSLPTFRYYPHNSHSLLTNGTQFTKLSTTYRRTSTILSSVVASAGNEDAELRVSSTQQLDDDDDEEEEEDDEEPTPQDLEYVAQIKRVLELLKKNRDMLFGEVKLTIMIEDPRDIERKRLLGIEDLDGPTRDDLVTALEEVNEGKIPKDKVVLQMLAEEMTAWPNLEVESTKKKPKKSLYAKTTDTGIDPKVAAKRLNIDWDTAAEIEDVVTDDEQEVPSVLGYGALYLVSAFPIIIGVSVVLILFYNSLQ
ncbi:ycf3-interacting protein 1, chloroplastic [Vicia villosa]|uniref:ycf3-interacting protein 1, chloroplastic n=1 Tax=Vicia villosa TaxID=3911 RepID=UPI00273CA855|nr:ycf3-interacting protein 1, chloroplastic [Vicia villosa]